MIVFFALLPAYFLSIFYRSFLSVIAGPVMTDLAIGPRELGLLGSAWFFAFALSQFPIGWALDRLGPRRTVTAAMAIGTVGAFLFANANGAVAGILAMALIGIGCSPIFMASLFLFARTAEASRFAFLTSVFIGLGSLGNIVGAAPLAIAAAHYGWRPSMLVMAGCFLVATALAGLLIHDPPRAESASGKAEGLIAGLASILKLRPLWLLAPITLTGYAILATARGLWVAPFMIDVHGLDAVTAGHAATAMALTMVVGAFIYGGLEKAMRRTKPLVFWGTVATAAAFALLAAAGASSAIVATALFALIGAIGFTYAILMAHARLFFPAHLIGRGMTAVNFLFISGAALAQSGSGWFIAGQRAAGLDAATTFAHLHWAFAGLLLASAAIYAFTPERPKA
ncbi:MAG TPA: MFS transporter [Bosea sp. (in: a-proteobacteria)]|uniref:MFS transporter n=1 Tax=Bosea sp. (in: a-proteobacteria) TaxID=1871050 RepID=UPI002E164321|nr:MFS transporter [Bosea sp. (in: a-proteobacteria)]